MEVVHFYAKHFKQAVFVPTIKIPGCPLGLCPRKCATGLDCFTGNHKRTPARTGAKARRFLFNPFNVLRTARRFEGFFVGVAPETRFLDTDPVLTAREGIMTIESSCGAEREGTPGLEVD